MKIIKYLILLLLLLVVGGALYIATLDGDYQVQESRRIKAPASLLYATVNNYRTWEEWGPWMEADQNMMISYPEQTIGEGASYNWKSETQGDGSMETVKAIPYSSIDQDITFITPMGESNSQVYWIFEPDGDGTKVTWGMKGRQSFMEKGYWATQDSTLSQTIRPMYAKGLANLDANVQEQMSAYTIHVDGITEHGGGFYMYTTAASAIPSIPEKMAEMMPIVHNYVQRNNIPRTGQPMTLYNEFDEKNGTAIFSTAIPTRDKVITPKLSGVLCGYLPNQKVVKATLKGNYTNLKEAWEKTIQYVLDNQLEQVADGVPFEVYTTDPAKNQNPATWITEIYIPIQ